MWIEEMVLEKKKPGIIDYNDVSSEDFIFISNLLNVKINWTDISVEKGSPDRLASVLNFYTFLFFLGRVLIIKKFV